jgi:hypothetical protein
MNKIIFVLVMTFFSLNAFAQENSKTNNEATPLQEFKASIKGMSLLINWKATDLNQNEYWEVQASADGKKYATIGIVLGADPKLGDGNYSFKSNTGSLRPGMKYYRVLNIQSETIAFASNSISVLK